MKFSIFADLHHHPIEYMGGTYEDLDFIYNRAKESGASFIIHAGDLIHKLSIASDYVSYYNNLPIPTYHCLGNHDADNWPRADVLKAYNMPPEGYYFFDCKGYRFIVCDPNYYRDGDEYIAYDMGNYYANGEKRDWIPPEQMEWLEKTIDEAGVPCIIISHESFEREADGVKNLKEVRELFARCNKRRPHAVLMCINGHYHKNNLRILDGILYFDLNSASFDPMGVSHNFFPADLCKEMRFLNTTIVYNDPIHAIVTLEGTTVTIEGMESSFYMDVDNEKAGFQLYDSMGRPTVPTVLSAKVTME